MNKPEILKMLKKAQSEFEPVIFDKFNPHFKNKYASLAAIKDAIEPALNKYGFLISQPIEALENGDLKLITQLIHESGEVISLGSMIIKGGRSDQQIGGSITYNRRYLISSAFFLFAEEDDDGERAEDRVNPPKDIKDMKAPSAAKPATLTAQQINAIKSQIKDREDIYKEVLEFTKKKTVSEIEYNKFLSVMNFIDMKMKKEGAA